MDFPTEISPSTQFLVHEIRKRFDEANAHFDRLFARLQQPARESTPFPCNGNSGAVPTKALVTSTDPDAPLGSGADNILINASTDCTEEFDASHSDKALLDTHRVGELIATGTEYSSIHGSGGSVLSHLAHSDTNFDMPIKCSMICSVGDVDDCGGAGGRLHRVPRRRPGLLALAAGPRRGGVRVRGHAPQSLQLQPVRSGVPLLLLVAKQCAWAIGNVASEGAELRSALAAGSFEHKKLIFASEPTPLLMHLLRTAQFDIRREAAYTLGNLCIVPAGSANTPRLIVTKNEAAQLTAKYRGQGFQTLKLKVGKNLNSDIEVLKAIQLDHPDCSFILDTNEEYTYGSFSFVGLDTNTLCDEPLEFCLFNNVAVATSVNGISVMSPFLLEFPEDKETYNGEAFMVGPSLLAQRIYEEGQRSVSVYLPEKESWYDLRNGSPYKESMIHKLQVLEDSIPSFQRAGTIVPRKDIFSRSSTQMVNDPYTLVIALNSSGAVEGELYMDDGKSYDYQQGAFIHRRFVFADNKLTSFNIAPDNLSKKFTRDCVIERIIVLGLRSGAKKAVIEPWRCPVLIAMPATSFLGFKTKNQRSILHLQWDSGGIDAMDRLEGKPNLRRGEC